ncbi:uncharacterized protein LOC143287616 isoform X2 [Babylonia areolata]|uniref:uncharacterized protein LOC143287616 isoform X2 n=1 Tax=Babylonia areolata TaxID=304850 RepID=UPI003FD45149
MAAAEQRMLESPTDIHCQISQRLQEDGLSPQCGEGEKLLYLWRLYLQVETDLKKARENEEKLKEAQTEEMQEVENYVEHIRHLSDEREALIQELETENEQLKSDLEQVRSELNGDAQKEASEMLTQQGLGEIAAATPSEQVAYLLVERAHLLDKIEGAHTPVSQSASGGRDSQELKEILEQERKDFEQELGQQRESASLMKEQLRKEHEEEISALMDENSKLEEELQEAKKKVSQLEKQTERLRQEQIEEHGALEDKQAELERDRDAAVKEKKSLSEHLASLESERDELQKEKVALSGRVSRLEKEKVSLELERDALEKERDSWKDSSTESASTPPFYMRPASPLRSPNDVALRKVIEEKTKLETEMISLRGQIRSLRNEKEAAEEETKKERGASEKLQVTIQQLQVKNKNLRQEVEEMEAQLDEAETAAEESKKLETEASQKYRLLQGEVKGLRGEAQRSSTLQDIVDILSNEKTELSSTLDGVRKEMQKVLAEREDLSCHNQQLSEGEQRLSGQLSQLKEEMTALERERDELFAERDDLMNTRNTQDGLLSSLRLELSSAQETRERISSTSEQLEKDNQQLQSKLEEVTVERDALRLSDRELSKQELIVTHLKEQIAGLTNQLSELQSQLEWARKTEQSLIDSQQTSQRAHTDSEKRLTSEIDDLRVKLQHALSELQAVKVAHHEQITAKSSLTEQLSLTESRLQETLQEKSSFQQELRNKSELEMQVRELEVRLAEKCRLADLYEDERKQRMELERKVQDLNQEQEFELSSLRTEAQTEKETRCELEFKLQELEQGMEEVKEEKEREGQSLTAKVRSLESQVQQLQNDLQAAQGEVTSLQHRCDQAEAEAEDARSEMAGLQAQVMDQASQAAIRSANTEELEASLTTMRKQLQDTLNELNHANSKVAQLEEQRAASKAELKKSLTDIRTLVFQKEVNSSKYQEMEQSVQSLRQDLKESKEALGVAKSQLRDKNSLLDTVRHETELLNRELEHLRETSASDSEEKNQQFQRLKVAEDKVRQLEKDNVELAGKLSESIHQREQLSEKLEKEKLRHTDSHHQSARYVEQLESDLNAANKHIRCLREELQQQQSSVFKLEASSLGQTAKYESMVSRLESELKEVKLQHRREMDTLTDKVTATAAESRDAKTDLREKEQTIVELRREVSKAQTGGERLQAQLMSESKARSDLENRNTTLEHEMTKVWSQVRMLMERNNHLESGKKMLEEDLDRKSNMVRQLENSLSSRESSLQSCLKEWQSRAESAEKQVKQLEQDLSLAESKVAVVEQQLKSAEVNQTDLSEKSHQLATVRNQLEGEKLQRTLLDQTVAELKHQVSLLKQREGKVLMDNKDLQVKVHDLEIRLDSLPDHTDTLTSYSFQMTMTDASRQSLMEQITCLQREVKALQYELLTSNERRDIDLQRLEERKQRAKVKLMKAREFYSVERTKCREHMRQMDNDLRLTRAALQKELEWKDKMDSNYKHLLEEKRELICRLTEQEEVIRDKTRSLSMVQVRAAYLEDENRHLQRRADSLSAQKHTLDRLVRDFQHNREWEAARQVEAHQHQQHLQDDGLVTTPGLNFTGGSTGTVTSDLGHSGDVTWEQDLADDGKLVFRPGSSLHHPSPLPLPSSDFHHLHSSSVLSQGFSTLLGKGGGGGGGGGEGLAMYRQKGGRMVGAVESGGEDDLMVKLYRDGVVGGGGRKGVVRMGEEGGETGADEFEA